MLISTLCAHNNREGFDAVLRLASVAGFSPLEMDVLVCGASEKWDRAMLLAATKPDHGYTHNRWVALIIFLVQNPQFSSLLLS